MIRLEYFGPADFDQLIGWITDEHLLTNWSGAMFRFPLTYEALEWYISETNQPDASAFVYKVVEVETGATVGHISLGGISVKNNAARISRVLLSNAVRGKGYCAPMIRAVLKIAFEELNLHRVALGVYNFNGAAIRCYEKAGFKTEGVMRDVLKWKDEYWSLMEMGILEGEWRALIKEA